MVIDLGVRLEIRLHIGQAICEEIRLGIVLKGKLDAGLEIRQDIGGTNEFDVILEGLEIGLKSVLEIRFD